jgi:hypothetical protein
MTGISTVCDFNSGNVYNVSKPGPVSMKVFGWTRFFVLRDAIVGRILEIYFSVRAVYK